MIKKAYASLFSVRISINKFIYLMFLKKVLIDCFAVECNHYSDFNKVLRIDVLLNEPKLLIYDYILFWSLNFCKRITELI